MKNINSNWLGTPPEHWKALKLRQILRPFSEKNHADLQLLSVVREALEITPEQYQYLMQGLEIVARHPIQEVRPDKIL